MIKIHNVSFGYTQEEQILKNINLHINKGECVLLCGKSGCGKTTVTKLINGLIPHFTDNCRLEGTVTVEGKNVAETQIYELAEKIGSVFQNPKSQFFNLDSDTEIVFGLENAGASPDSINERLRATTKALNIERLRRRSIFSMSAGEKQSLAFASSYAMNPHVYVLDEPTANLDEGAIEVLREQIAKIKEEGKTVLIAEHRIYFLMDLIDRAVLMEKGEIVRIFTREAFLTLSEDERIKMGLRTLGKKSVCPFPHIPDHSAEALTVKNLCCKIKENIIFEQLSFSVKNGDILGITGSNGAGKTTLLRCIAGLIKQSEGELLLDGRPLNKKTRNRLCYLIMQDVNHQLFSDSLWNECELSGGEAEEGKIEEVLHQFDLSEWKHSHPMALSGGQKQRLAIAAGVLQDKKIVLFDEPTSGLDYEHMLAVSATIKGLAQKGHIVIIVTHDTEFLECTCNRTIVL
ncbi:MAG: ABC transporter ATP-binding protein [Firmicutes bacterium]|nr:ABC transporter ATP-binding protein [Bacillota bacterium]